MILLYNMQKIIFATTTSKLQTTTPKKNIQPKSGKKAGRANVSILLMYAGAVFKIATTTIWFSLSSFALYRESKTVLATAMGVNADDIRIEPTLSGKRQSLVIGLAGTLIFLTKFGNFLKMISDAMMPTKIIKTIFHKKAIWHNVCQIISVK